jgi:regulatory protein PHO2
MSSAISIIPSYELTIGTWRRLATQVGKHDLVTYVCENRRCFVWYVQSAGYGFKIEVPFDYIKEATYRTTVPGRGLASFYLTQPPTFFIEQPDGVYTGKRSWKRSADWTESSQASHELRHDLIASSAQLAHVLRHYNLPLATPTSDSPGFSPLAPFPSASASSSASTGYEPPPIPRLNESLNYGHGYPEQPSALRSSAVNPIEMQRRASYASLRSVSGLESLDYSIDVDHSSRSAPSLQPSPAPSYGSPSSYASPSYTPYSQLAPSPGPANVSYSSSSPGPGVPQYPNVQMYSASHNVLDDATHVPLSSRGYGATAYGLPASAATSPSVHSPHFAGYGMPAPSTSPSLMGAPYAVAQSDLGAHASSGVVPQPSGLVGDANLLHALHYDDGHQAHHQY